MKPLPFQVSQVNGIAWPHTGPAFACISAKERARRLAIMATFYGRKVIVGMYIKL